MKKLYLGGVVLYLMLLLVTLGLGVMEAYVLSGRWSDPDSQDAIKATLGVAVVAVWRALVWVKLFHDQALRTHRNFTGLIAGMLLGTIVVYSQYDTLSEVPYHSLPLLLLGAAVHLLVVWTQIRQDPFEATDAPLDAPF